MGLFDKLFRRKPKPTKPPAVQQTSVAYRPTAGRPVKGPPRVQTGKYAAKSNFNVQSSPYYKQSTPRYNLDDESKKILEASLAKIKTTIPDSGMKRQPKVGSSPTPSVPGTGLEDPGLQVKTTVSRPPEAKVVTAKKPLADEMTGEEELFKKLIQMDKELQQKIVAKKEAIAAPPTAKPIEKKPAAFKDLKRKELELRKLEEKLREKEKKLKEMESMNKTFNQLKDAELEQFSTVGSGGVGAGAVAGVPKVDETGKLIDGVDVHAEDEDLYQPLKNLSFNNFIVGPSNRFAHDVALSVAKAPADAYNPLFIYSEVGLGKTHLLCAIGNYILTKIPNAKIVYVSSEKFTNELLDFLRLGEMEKFRTKYRNVDVLLIDDIQFIGGQEGTQEEFFHTFNALYNAHKQIVITSDRPPKNITHLKDRLRSRFEGGLIVNIKLPDLGTRTMILHEKAEKDGIYIPDEIINYIAAKVKSNVRTLIGVLNRIVAHSSLSDRELDKILVDDVLRDVVDEGIDITGA